MHHVFDDLSMGTIAVRADDAAAAISLVGEWLAARIKDGVDGYDHADWERGRLKVGRGPVASIASPAVCLSSRCRQGPAIVELHPTEGPDVVIVAGPCDC